MAAAGSSTRDRILQTSLRLFNEEGVAAVSTHRVAAEMGISPGNLHYHFKTKQAIVTWLFRRFRRPLLRTCLDGAARRSPHSTICGFRFHLTFETISDTASSIRDIDYLPQRVPPSWRPARRS